MTTELFVETYNRQPLDGEVVEHNGDFYTYSQGSWNKVKSQGVPEHVI